MHAFFFFLQDRVITSNIDIYVLYTCIYIYSSQNIYMRSGYKVAGVTGLVHMHALQSLKIPRHFVWCLPFSTTSRNLVSCQTQ